MTALNTVHNYSRSKGIPVNLEMHWQHGEEYLYHPGDPETVVERMEWIFTKYGTGGGAEVGLSHKFNSDLFDYSERPNHRHKVRFLFDSEAYHPILDATPPNEWDFPSRKGIRVDEGKLVVWTPHYNREPPRGWKTWFTSDDWGELISDLKGKWGWNVVELTYRTPVRDAFNQIRKARCCVSYDGMWHYVARNLGKPHLIPSKEGVTKYHTPRALAVKTREEMFNFPENLKLMDAKLAAKN